MKIEILKEKGSNCFVNLIISIANYWNVEYKLMYLELIGFSYKINNSSKNIGENMQLCWEGDLKERNRLLENYHGIHIEYFDKTLWDNKCSKEWIDNHIVAIYVDGYECEWLPFYKKLHRQHICLIVEKKEEGYLLDDEYLEAPKYMEKEKIQFIQSGFIIFEKIVNKNKIEIENIKKELRHRISIWYNNDSKDKLLNFSSDIKGKLDLTKEVSDNKDPFSSRLFMYLKNIGDDKKRIADMFVFLQLKTGENYDEIVNKFNQLSEEYLKFRSYLIKLLFLGKKIDDLVKIKIDAIIKAEMEIEKWIESYSNYNFFENKGEIK